MFERIKNRLGIQSTTSSEVSGESRSDVSKIQAFLRGWDIDGNLNETRALDPYVQNITVFRCINAIATAITTAQFRLQNDKSRLTSGSIYELMLQPNPMMDQSSFFEFVVTSINSSGNCFIYIDDPDSNGIPRSLLPFPSYFIEPERGEFIYELKFWKLKTKNGRWIQIPKENMIHIRYAPNPTDPIMGVGPMQVSALAIDSDWSASNYNKNILRNGGQPSGILIYKGPGRLTEEMKDEIRQAWQRTYGGPRNAFRLAVMNNEWSFQPTGSSQRDMEFGDSRRWNLHDISRAFGVPLIYLNDYDSTGSSYGGLEIQRKMFYEDVIMPLAAKIASSVTRELLSKIDKKLSCTFDFSNVIALREDFGKKVEAAEKLAKMGFSLNNINKRLELGMTQEPWGDEHLAPVNMVPVSDIVNHSVQLPSNEVKQQLQGQAGTSQKKTPQEKDTAKTISSFIEKASYIKEIESRCINKMHRTLLSQRASILSNINEDYEEIRNAHSMMNSVDIAESFMQPIMTAYLDGIDSLITNLVESGRVLPNISEYIRNKSKLTAPEYFNSRFDYLCEFSDGLRSFISQAIEDGISRGETSNDIKSRIKKVSNKIIRKIEVVCRHEVFCAFNNARYMVAGEIDSATLEWLKGDSEHCSGECENNSPVEYGATFANGKKHPGDLANDENLIIGCNCILNVV